ncbi:MAG: rhomboid family intramembrane serine protease [Anaerolineae bacterium]
MNQPPASSPDLEPGAPPSAVSVSLPDSAPNVTYGILFLTIAIYVLQLLSVAIFGDAYPGLDYLTLYGARINEAIRAGQLWRFLTPALLHASIPHILFNMYALLSFGPGLEQHFGHKRFLLLYLLSAFAGNALSFLLSPAYSVGASTAIFGLVGAEGIFLYHNRKLFGQQARRALSNVLFIVFINLLLGGIQPGIDNWGHIGGLLGGLIFAWFAGPRWEIEGIYPFYHLQDQRQMRDVILGASLVLVLFGSLALLGF